MGNKDACFSRGKDDWETPEEVFGPLNEEFGFDLDVCASHENAKCADYFTKENDGLLQDWTGHICWCNPPYSEWQKWVEKASEESIAGATVVMLLPARTDTVAFHEYIWGRPYREIRFIRGRIRFVGAEHGAPFPSMIVIFRPPSPTNPAPTTDNFWVERPLLSYRS